MDHNLGDLRQLVFDEADWAPTASADATAWATRALNQAQLKLAEDFPMAFNQTTGHFSCLPSAAPTSTSDTLKVSGGDAWVLEQTLVAASATVAMPTDRSWDGRELRVKDASGNWHVRRIRTIWAANPGGGTKKYLTIDKPWINATDTGLAYHVSSPDYYLPAEVVQVQAVRFRLDAQMLPIEILTQEQLERRWFTDDPRIVPTGSMLYAARRPGFQLPAPTYTPTVALTSGNLPAPWGPPEPAGQFDFCYTHCWGLRSQEWQNRGPLAQASTTASSGRFEPLWESAPSPVSAKITATYTGNAILVGTPDVAFQQGFGSASSVRYNQTGWFKRIYMRRYTATGGPHAGLVETTNAFFLLDEIDAFTTSYTVDGSKSPDFFMRLRDFHGYQGLRFYPMPNAAYEVEVRYTSRPAPLRDDSDVSTVDPMATRALVLLASAQLYEKQGNWPARAVKLQDYADELVTLGHRFASLQPPGQPIRRAMVRAPNRFTRYGGNTYPR